MKLIFVILILFTSCEKGDVKFNCLKCYTNNTTGKVFVYDTCVLEGQRSWRDENINCYIK